MGTNQHWESIEYMSVVTKIRRLVLIRNKPVPIFLGFLSELTKTQLISMWGKLNASQLC
jgi:hypothetical protein